MSDTVLRDLKDGVLTLNLNRPEKKNAFNTEQWKACAAELHWKEHGQKACRNSQDRLSSLFVIPIQSK